MLLLLSFLVLALAAAIIATGRRFNIYQLLLLSRRIAASSHGVCQSSLYSVLLNISENTGAASRPGFLFFYISPVSSMHELS